MDNNNDSFAEHAFGNWDPRNPYLENIMELTIRERRMAQGMSASELARRLGTSAANVSRWEREPQRINLLTLEQIAAVLGTTPDKLINIGDPVPVREGAGRSSVVVTIQNLQEDKPPLPFDRDYLLTVTRHPHTELGSAIVEDDANAPTLRIGDALLVAPCERATAPGLYVSLVDGDLRVRRVMPGLKSGTISVMTDNSAYPDFNDVSEDNFPVTGKVIWVGRKV